MKKLDIDQLIENPKNAKERVAVCFFLLMTCPDTKKNEAKLENILNHMCEDLEELDKDLWIATQELAKQIAVQENAPFYQENVVWIESKLAEVTGSVQKMEGVH
jgi:cob(I)alamin adenosyltransferase